MDETHRGKREMWTKRSVSSRESRCSVKEGTVGGGRSML